MSFSGSLFLGMNEENTVFSEYLKSPFFQPRSRVKEEGEPWAEDWTSLMKVLSSSSEGTIPQYPSCPDFKEKQPQALWIRPSLRWEGTHAWQYSLTWQTPLLNSCLGNEVVSGEPFVSLVMELPGLLSVVLKTVWHKELLEPSSSAQPLTGFSWGSDPSQGNMGQKNQQPGPAWNATTELWEITNQWCSKWCSNGLLYKRKLREREWHRLGDAWSLTS